MENQNFDHTLTIRVPLPLVKKMRAEGRRLGLTLTSYLRFILTKQHSK